jgi:hypothetical protein
MSQRFVWSSLAALSVFTAIGFVVNSTLEEPQVRKEKNAGKSIESHSETSSSANLTTNGVEHTTTTSNHSSKTATGKLSTKPTERPQVNKSTPSSSDPISSGPMRSSSAVGGKPAHARALVGKTEVKLKPDQEGSFQQLQAKSNQAIEFTVSYPWLKKNSEVTVGVMDGGNLSGSPVCTSDERGNITFTFTTGAYPGAYRILLNTPDGDRKSLEIWVEEGQAS